LEQTHGLGGYERSAPGEMSDRAETNKQMAPWKMFHWLLNIAVVNSMIIYKQEQGIK
jgi:hypothetical protein